jgi:hypothetical protein
MSSRIDFVKIRVNVMPENFREGRKIKLKIKVSEEEEKEKHWNFLLGILII